MSRQMERAARLAALLADGDWHRGPELAQALDITRARVSQHVRTLRELGLDVFAVNGRGYRLREPLALLEPRAMRAQLGADNAAMLGSLDVLPVVDSTNAWLGQAGAHATQACFAEYQSAGRGRQQRAWRSPFGANLYFSVAHAMRAPRAPLGALSLAVGVSLVERLRALGATGVGLKWPNDVLVDGAKLAGILSEHRGEAGGGARLIVGVGLNVAMEKEQATAVDQPWTRLRDCMQTLPPRNELAGQALDAVLAAVREFQAQGFAPFQSRWQALDVTRDREVAIDDGDHRRFGMARGIGRDGALQVEMDGGIESIYAGDVSLRVVT